MITIITEKRSFAEQVSKAVGANNDQKGYFEGNGYYVTWAAGHLLEKHVPQAEGEWSLQKLPILPDEFQLVPRTEKGPSGKKVTDTRVEKRLYIIRSLLSRSTGVINAGDPGMEGELIQREIMQYTGCRLPVRRLWCSSTTPAAIREAMNNLLPSSQFDPLYHAGKSRSEADWLVGINATIALTCSTESNKTLSLGRVQTPVLGMVCRRFIENNTFKPEPFWKTVLELTTPSGETFILSSERIMNESDAEAAIMNAQRQGAIKIDTFTEETIAEQPPLLYDLTELENAAGRKFKYSGKETDAAIQALYEAGYVSYPRTPSQYITEHEYKMMSSLIQGLRNYQPLSSQASRLNGQPLNRHAVNEVKVTDHHGLIITENVPEGLAGIQKDIYELIATRMLEAFGPVCYKVIRHAEGTIGETRYKASANIITEPGWREIRGVGAVAKDEQQAKNENDTDSDDLVMNIPHLTEGQSYRIQRIRKTQGMTTPPRLYTESTLRTAMKNTGAKPDAAALQKGMQKGLGTPATRTAIIETLKTREYIKESGKEKFLEPTVLGMTVYRIVKNKAIANADMTAQWEEALENIIDERISADEFDKRIRTYAAQLTEDLIMGDHRQDILQTATKEAFKCPNCGKINYTSPKGYFCRKCDFRIFRTIAGKKLTDGQMKQLAEGGETLEISGFKRKDGTPFNARLRLENMQVKFVK